MKKLITIGTVVMAMAMFGFTSCSKIVKKAQSKVEESSSKFEDFLNGEISDAVDGWVEETEDSIENGASDFEGLLNNVDTLSNAVNGLVGETGENLGDALENAGNALEKVEDVSEEDAEDLINSVLNLF